MSRSYLKSYSIIGWGFIRWILVCGFFLFAVLILNCLHARTWRVPSDVVTIKIAVEDSAQYGDTVLVASGIYNTLSGEVFPINLKNGVVLISESGASETTIDAENLNRVIECHKVNNASVISGFTITGGYAQHGGAIYCDSSSMVISLNNIANNRSISGGSGGGIYCSYGEPQIINNYISENAASDWMGGGIYLFFCTGEVVGNRVIKNTSKYGAGIFMDNSSPLVTNNFVEGNYCTESGGGLDCYMNSSPTLIGNVVVRNIARTHGVGIACCYFCSPTIQYNTIVGNIGQYGGGIRTLGGSSATIEDNIIVDNVDAIYLMSDSDTIWANNNNIYYNTYQNGDYEVINNTSVVLNLTNNYWWETDSVRIDSCIKGFGNFIPFRISANPNAPGEPSAVDSVTAMSDSTYSTPLNDPVQIGDNLYIQVVGSDWNPSYTEPAIVIITSNKDPYGIAVALIETAAESGIYRGIASIDTTSDDLNNHIGSGEVDILILKSNIDMTKCDTVYVQPIGVNEERIDLFKKKLYGPTIINGSLPLPAGKRFRIFDIAGREVKAERIRPGIYFVEIEGRIASKVVKIR